MCDKCNDPLHQTAQPGIGRRGLLMAGAGLAAAPLLVAGAKAQAQTTETGSLAATTARAWGASAAGAPVSAMDIPRRAVGPNDVQLQILYCGVCHSDIHMVADDWGGTPYPLVPGHEIIGRVTAVGANVTRFKVGDIGGVGCMVDSCGTCSEWALLQKSCSIGIPKANPCG